MILLSSCQADWQESGPPQAMATPGKTPAGAVGGRADHGDQVDSGCCGSCVVL